MNQLRTDEKFVQELKIDITGVNRCWQIFHAIHLCMIREEDTLAATMYFWDERFR
jgi:hypothetical protein